MKKILAVLLALTMVLALAACGAKTEETTTAPEESEVITEAPVEEVPTEEATEAPSEEAEAPSEEESTEAEETKGLTSTDIKEVVDFYNAAQANTKENAPKGTNKMVLVGDITGDGALGVALKVAMPIIKSTLEKNSSTTDYIPGDADDSEILESDVTEASATSKNGVTTIYIKLKNQTDGPQADAHTAGPVARGIGTLGNVDTAIQELGAEVYSGKDTISLLYNDAYIKCTVDEETGRITGGTWHYKVNVSIANAELKLGVKISVKNLKACIDYTVSI